MGLNAIISGGGICGLATGAALARRGWEVTVFESRPELRVSGSGIYLHNNGLAVLRDVGAAERTLVEPFIGRGIEQRDELGQLVVPASLPPGAQLLAVPRADLIAGLEGAARSAGVRIRMKAEIVDALADGTFVFANGDRVSADVAIGCDGLWSAVRRALGLELYRQRSAEGALRTIIRATQDDLPPETRGNFIENWNGKRRLLITPISREEIYLALTCPEEDEEGRDTRIRPCWKEAFPMWAHLIDRITDAVTWGVYTVVKCKSWSAGRACIVGDAAHATTPNLGQGGGMAMQNGVALSAYLANVADPRDIPAALEAWERATRPLTELCQYWASLFGEVANIPNELRPWVLRGALSDPWVLDQMSAGARSTPITHVEWTPPAR